MYYTREEFAAAHRTNIDTSLTLANVAFAYVEHIAALNLNMARTVLEDVVASAKSLLDAKDIHEFASLQAAMVQPAVEKTVGYARGVYDVAFQRREEVSQLIETQFAEMGRNVVTSLENVAKNAPAGSDAAVAAVKSAIAVTNSTYDSLRKTARQVVDVAEANVAATSKAVTAPKERKAA